MEKQTFLGPWTSLSDMESEWDVGLPMSCSPGARASLVTLSSDQGWTNDSSGNFYLPFVCSLSPLLLVRRSWKNSLRPFEKGLWPSGNRCCCNPLHLTFILYPDMKKLLFIWTCENFRGWERQGFPRRTITHPTSFPYGMKYGYLITPFPLDTDQQVIHKRVNNERGVFPKNPKSSPRPQGIFHASCCPVSTEGSALSQILRIRVSLPAWKVFCRILLDLPPSRRAARRRGWRCDWNQQLI